MSIEAIKEAMEAGPTDCGEWRWWPCKSGDYKPGHDYVQLASGHARVAQVRIQSVTEADLKFIAACNPVAIRELIERLEAAEKDAARLDWLTKQFRAMSLDMGGNHCWVLARSGSIRGPNMIAAIDSAMQSGGLAEGVSDA